MAGTICGTDCLVCPMNTTCKGCTATNGSPLGGECVIAACCKARGSAACEECDDKPCALKKQLLAEINALGIEDMDEVTELYALPGAFINLEYTLSGGQRAKFWDDSRIYLGTQLEKKGTGRCYGLTADKHYLMVSEYGENGADAGIVVYKKRSQ